ncbi:hypothetical protein ACG04R_21615 [Roseateles sp. BYS78W]|uniref:Uncharacterized protein n=1 Tax=Pelomonas candidula TaxID=3299025 RepID=A0ABW7HHD1_9BURK
MHVEPPSHAPTNLKELGIHYLMIVVGILTALGLESGIEALHHRRLSHQTIEQVESELQANLADARASLKQNQTALKDLTALTNDVKQLIRDGQAKPAVLEPLLTQRLHIGIAVPGLRRDAWDTAVADQALVHLPRADLRRLSEAYTAQRDAQMSIQASFSAVGSFTRLTDAMVDAQFGRGDPIDLVKALNAYRLTISAVVSVESSLEGQLAESLAGAAHAPAAAASAASPASAH